MKGVGLHQVMKIASLSKELWQLQWVTRFYKLKTVLVMIPLWFSTISKHHKMDLQKRIENRKKKGDLQSSKLNLFE